VHLHVLPYRKVSPSNIGFRFVVLTNATRFYHYLPRALPFLLNSPLSDNRVSYLKPRSSVYRSAGKSYRVQ